MRVFLFVFAVLIPSFYYSQPPIYKWSQIFAEEDNAPNTVNITDIEQDQNGDVIVLGWFSDQLVFSPETPESIVVGNLQDNYGGAFLAKFTKKGELIWLKSFEAPDGYFLVLRPVDLKLAGNGGIVIYGRFLGTFDADPDENSEYFASSASGSAFSMFILKLDNNANFDWVKTFEYDLSAGPSNWLDIVPTAIEVDLDDNVYAIGQCTGRVDFNPNPLDTSFAHQGSVAQNRAFLVKLSKEGDFVWKKTFGTHYKDNLTMIKRGLDNDLYFGCVYHDSIHVMVAGQDVLLNHPPGFWPDDEDFFMAKMDTSGQIEWITRIVGGGDQYITDVEVDNNGEIYACGSFIGSVTLSPFVQGSYAYSFSEGLFFPNYSDGFLIKYASHGAPIWGTVITSKDSDNLAEIEITDSNVYVVGSIGDSLHVGFDFMGYSELPSYSAIDDTHGGFLKFSKDGQCQWVQRLESNGAYKASIKDVVIDGNDIFSVGNFGYDIDFDPSIEGSEYQMAYGGIDGFVHKMIFTADTFNVSQYAVYPNPFSDIVNLYAKDYENTQMAIFDIQGRLIQEVKLESKITAIDLKNEAGGVYLVLITNGERREVIRIVKE